MAKGRCSCICGSEGDITVIGAITPAKQITLFEEKPFRKNLAKFEAKVAYGFPVIGNVGVYAAIDIYLWAQLGPGILKDIKAQGTYSTDPRVRQNYSIEANLNISAAGRNHLKRRRGIGLDNPGS